MPLELPAITPTGEESITTWGELDISAHLVVIDEMEPIATGTGRFSIR